MNYSQDPFYSACALERRAARLERAARFYLLTLGGFALGGVIVWAWA